jgi:hypothetical protein
MCIRDRIPAEHGLFKEHETLVPDCSAVSLKSHRRDVITGETR